MRTRLFDLALAIGGLLAMLPVLYFLVVPPAIEKAAQTANSQQQELRKQAIEAWTALPPLRAVVMSVSEPDSRGYVTVEAEYLKYFPIMEYATVTDPFIVPDKPFIVEGGRVLIYQPDPYHPMTSRHFPPGSSYFADPTDPMDGPHVMFPKTRPPTPGEVGWAIRQEIRSSLSMYLGSVLTVLGGPIAVIVLAIRLALSPAPLR